MKIITFAAIKGGVGKTTLTYNFGEYLAKTNKVLLIDTDPQASLSQTYELYSPETSFADIFEAKPAKDIIVHKDSIDLIPSTLGLNDIELSLETRTNKELLLYMWFYDNYDYLSQYDYVLIDCHPDFSVITQNAIVLSDLVLSPIEPSKYSFNAKTMLEVYFANLQKSLVSPDKRQSYVEAKLRFIGNRIRKNQSASQVFVDKMKQDKTCIAYIPEKELLNQSTLFSTPIINMPHDKNKIFFNDIFKTFNELASLA